MKVYCMQVVLATAVFLGEEIFNVIFHKKAVNIFTINMRELIFFLEDNYATMNPRHSY